MSLTLRVPLELGGYSFQSF